MRTKMAGALSHKGGPMSALKLKAMVAATAVAAAVAATPTLAAGDTNWQIHLHGSTAYPRVNGSAQYQSQPGQSELQIEVQNVRSLAGKTVTFLVGGKYVGSGRISTLGQADITKNTELGRSVPSVTHGTRVTVRTVGGTLIVSGQF
jgi:hypothetical protein